MSFFAALAMLALSATAPAPTPDRLLWNDVPLAITVPVGTEAVMRLPTACEVGVPPELAGKLRIELVKNVLLLKATEAFPPARVALRSIAGNHVYLIDVAAAKAAGGDRFELIDPALTPAPRALAQTESALAPAGDVRIALTRFASREFYAAERLRGGLNAVRIQVPVAQVEIYRGQVVRAIVRAGWSYRRHYVTAIELRNLTPDSQELDPRMLRGDWLTATFQHGVVAPAGHDGELTMLYVVSARPFRDTLL